MTEKEKMLAGEIYSAVDPQLIEELTEVKEIIHDYNLLRPSEKEKAREILKGLLGHIADDEILIIQPFYCDYGKQISVGKRFFANFNFTVLDEAPVTIGDAAFEPYLCHAYCHAGHCTFIYAQRFLTPPCSHHQSISIST